MTTPLDRKSLQQFAENPGLWPVVASQEEVRLAVLAALTQQLGDPNA